MKKSRKCCLKLTPFSKELVPFTHFMKYLSEMSWVSNLLNFLSFFSDSEYYSAFPNSPIILCLSDFPMLVFLFLPVLSFLSIVFFSSACHVIRLYVDVN